MSLDRLSERSGGVIGTIGPIRGSGVFSLQERHALSVDNYNDVSLYLKMNGANGSTTFYDSSLYGHTVTANGNAQISTAQSKFGGASLYLDGTGDYLTIPDSAFLQMGSGDFTVEFWWYPVNLTGYQTPIDKGYIASGALVMQTGNGDGKLAVYFSGGSVAASSTAVTTNSWFHIAVVRNGATVTLYQNGISTGSGTSSVNLNNSSQLVLGANGDFLPDVNIGTFPINGYIDDLRITKGVARYTGNFTPPQRQFRP